MYGDASTIIWMYLNTAPNGWTVLATGADMVLAVAGGGAAYNVNGGNPDSVATWTISGLTANSHAHTVNAHTHTGPSHSHQWYDYETPGGGVIANSYNVSGTVIDIPYGITTEVGITITAGTENQIGDDLFTAMAGTGNTGSTSPDTGAASANGVTHSPAWRPKASVGKLFQLNG
jgi:hypothetical protein